MNKKKQVKKLKNKINYIEEIWKAIDGYENYMVSNLGRVCKILKPQINSQNGYAQIYLSKDKEKKMLYAHRLVAKSFIPNPENKPTVNHEDFDRSNNIISNLKWSEYSEQSTHNYENGRSLKYVDLYKNRKKIAEYFSKGKITRVELAKKHNVPLHTLHKFCISGLNTINRKLSKVNIYNIIGERILDVPVKNLSKMYNVSDSLIHAYYRNYVNTGKIMSTTNKTRK